MYGFSDHVSSLRRLCDSRKKGPRGLKDDQECFCRSERESYRRLAKNRVTSKAPREASYASRSPRSGHRKGSIFENRSLLSPRWPMNLLMTEDAERVRRSRRIRCKAHRLLQPTLLSDISSWSSIERRVCLVYAEIMQALATPCTAKCTMCSHGRDQLVQDKFGC